MLRLRNFSVWKQAASSIYRIWSMLSRLAAGEVYELMCHPGEFDAQEVTDTRLRLSRLGR
jgi:hypothetical protein